MASSYVLVSTIVLNRSGRASSVRACVVGGVIASPPARCDDVVALHPAEGTPRQPPATEKESRTAGMQAHPRVNPPPMMATSSIAPRLGRGANAVARVWTARVRGPVTERRGAQEG